MSSSSVPVAKGATPHELPTLGVVLVAAGRGERLGADEPKAFVKLRSSTLIEHCIKAISALPHAGHLVVVTPDSHAAAALELVGRSIDSGSSWAVSVVHGGRERHESVRFGLEALPDHIEVVLVHDAARPLAPTELFERVSREVQRTGDAVIPVLPVADTLKRVDSQGVVHETVDRAPLVSVQTPQGFMRERLAAAHESLRIASGPPQSPGDVHVLPTDDAEVVQRSGDTVRTVPGDTAAHKLTTAGDLALLEALFAIRGDSTARGARS